MDMEIRMQTGFWPCFILELNCNFDPPLSWSSMMILTLLCLGAQLWKHGNVIILTHVCLVSLYKHDYVIILKTSNILLYVWSLFTDTVMLWFLLHQTWQRRLIWHLLTGKNNLDFPLCRVSVCVFVCVCVGLLVELIILCTYQPLVNFDLHLGKWPLCVMTKLV